MKLYQEFWTKGTSAIKNNSNTYSFIFASASLNLTIASSCLTVIGIAAASPVSFACCLISCINIFFKKQNKWIIFLKDSLHKISVHGRNMATFINNWFLIQERYQKTQKKDRMGLQLLVTTYNSKDQYKFI